MSYVSRLRGGFCLAGCASFALGSACIAPAQEKSIEEETKIHRLTSLKRAPYDAFTYVNRIPESPEEDETPVDLAGRVFGRLGNQEGRVELKLPPGMTKESYLSYKTFMQYEGEAKAGNCVACHVPAEFTDGKEHVVTKGGSPVATPSLRNLKEKKVDYAAVIARKIAASEQKRSGEADEIDDAYATMRLNEQDIPGLVAFLNLLDDVDDGAFRQLVLNGEILDTTHFFD